VTTRDPHEHGMGEPLTGDPGGTGQPPPGTPMRLGDALVASGVLTPDQLKRALAEQRSSGQRLGELLVEQGIVTPGALVQALAAVQGVPGCRLRHGLIDPALIKLIGAGRVRAARAASRCSACAARSRWRWPTREPPRDRPPQEPDGPARAPGAGARDGHPRVRQEVLGRERRRRRVPDVAERVDVEVVEREASTSTTATDLDHDGRREPDRQPGQRRAAHRGPRRGERHPHRAEPDAARGSGTASTGMLRDLMRPPPGMHAAIVSRVKVIGKMDIAEKRLPQEGRVRIVAEGREIDLRVSSMPTLLGEKLVVRVLDKSNLHVDMDQLGMRARGADAGSSACSAAARDGAGHGPDGQRQDDDALLRARPAPQRGAQHRDRRGPGRVPARDGQPDPGQRADRAHLRPGAPARSSARTPTSSWSARSATRRPPASRCRPR
jgi:type IV pilus assembly protein PilB